MATPEAWAEAVVNAPSWNARVALIRRIPEEFGTAQQTAVYARVAERVYVPHLKPDFAYVHWRPSYEFAPIMAAYEDAVHATDRFRQVEPSDLMRAIRSSPERSRCSGWCSV